MSENSNIDEIVDWLRSVVEGFDFTRKGADQSLGKDLCNIVAAGIAQRSSTGVGPDGQSWNANSADYAADKAKHYGWPSNPGPVNYRTGQMLSHASLLGTPEVSPHEITMRYGIGAGPGGGNWSPQDSRTPSQRKGDDASTDVDKAGYALKRNQRFYEPDEADREAVIAAAGEALADYIGEVG